MGAMKRITSGNHPDVFLEKNDTVIFSSKIIPGNEKKLYAMHNEIVKNHIEIITEENAFVHVSGHPNRDDLKDMYGWVKPKSIIPVHGEHRHMIEQAKFAKEMKVPHSLQIENGDIIRIHPGDNPVIIDKAPSGRMYLDGSISVREDSNSIKERRNLALNGYLEVTLPISNNGKIKKPVISFKGLPLEDLDETLIFDMEDEIASICKSFSIQNKKQEYNLIDTLKQNCRRMVREKTGKKPYTRINLARI
jgi:ribonuclease J